MNTALSSARQLILTDSEDLYALFCVSGKDYRHHSETDILFYLTKGKVYGVFSARKLVAAAVIMNGNLFCRLTKGIKELTKKPSFMLFLPVVRSHEPQLSIIVEALLHFAEKDSPRLLPLVLTLPYSSRIPPELFFDCGYELIRLATCVNMRPYYIFAKAKQALPPDNICKTVSIADALTLSRLLENGYVGRISFFIDKERYFALFI